MLDRTVSVGDLLTALAIVVSAAGILYELHKDRSLRRKEIADRVRRSAGLLIAKIHRWQSISESLYTGVHALVTEVDEMLVNDKNAIKVRDHFWRHLWALRTERSDKVRDEQIELSFADLYGYDPRVLDLFDQTLADLQDADLALFLRLLSETQEEILSFEDNRQPASAELGNMLRRTIAQIGSDHGEIIDTVLTPFRAEMERLVRATDAEIARRKVKLALTVRSDSARQWFSDLGRPPEADQATRLLCVMPDKESKYWVYRPPTPAAQPPDDAPLKHGRSSGPWP